MKQSTSFAIVGLNQEEMYALQLFLNIMRYHPLQAETLVLWLAAVVGGHLSPEKCSPKTKSSASAGVGSSPSSAEYLLSMGQPELL